MRNLFAVMISLAFIWPANASDRMLHCIKEKHFSYRQGMSDKELLERFKEFDNPTRRLEPDASLFLKVKELDDNLQIIVTTPEQPGESWEYISFVHDSFDFFEARRGTTLMNYDGEYLTYASVSVRWATIMMLRCRTIN